MNMMYNNYSQNSFQPLYTNNGYSQQVSQRQTGLRGYPVSSLEEVRAAQIDFDGSLYLFPDLAHNRIYTKQISMDGNASLNMYELTQIPTPNNQQVEVKDFVTREEFEAAMGQLKEFLNKTQTTSPAQGEAPQQFNF